MLLISLSLSSRSSSRFGSLRKFPLFHYSSLLSFPNSSPILGSILLAMLTLTTHIPATGNSRLSLLFVLLRANNVCFIEFVKASWKVSRKTNAQDLEMKLYSRCVLCTRLHPTEILLLQRHPRQLNVLRPTTTRRQIRSINITVWTMQETLVRAKAMLPTAHYNNTLLPVLPSHTPHPLLTPQF